MFGASPPPQRRSRESDSPRSPRSPRVDRLPGNFPDDQRAVLELRRDLRAANRARQFESSKEMSKRLHSLIQTNEKDAVASAVRKLGDQITAQGREYELIVARLQSEFEQREKFLREAVDGSFAELQDRQLRLLTELELYHKQENVRAAKRHRPRTSSPSSASRFISPTRSGSKRQLPSAGRQ
jgi:hypothetical protein